MRSRKKEGVKGFLDLIFLHTSRSHMATGKSGQKESTLPEHRMTPNDMGACMERFGADCSKTSDASDHEEWREI